MELDAAPGGHLIPHVLLGLLLGAEPEALPTVALETEVQVYGGALVQAVLYRNGAQTDGAVALGLAGRYRALPSEGFARHLYLEADAAALLPAGGSALFSGTAVVRGGLAFDTWGVSVGVYANILTAPRPVQLAPSISAVWHPSWWGFSLGLFDRPLAGFGHLDVDLGPFSIGYSAPLGVDLGFKPPLGGGFALDVHLFGWTYQAALQAGGSVGLVWRPPAPSAPARAPGPPR